jgi:DNA-binding NarL/FixJ family response regulator
MPKMPRYKVLLVDDHAVVRHGLRSVLEEELGDVAVEEAGTARDGMKCLRQNKYDALILDIGLPDRNGLDLLKSIHSEWPELPVLILSMFDESQYGVRMIKAGAAGYVTKASAPEKFVIATRKILAGGRYREYQIFLMIASGKTVSEIADDLCLSVKTVSTHRAHVLQKTNMKTNAELTHYAFFKGLVQ